MKSWFWIPLAGLAGLIVGSWGPRAELRVREQQLVEEKAKAKSTPDAFSSFARMVNIPDEARHPRRKGKERSKPLFAATNQVARVTVDEAPATNAVASAEQENEPAASAPQEAQLKPEDLRARIEEAQEIWRARVDVARANWKEKLKLDEATSQKFDATLDEMNTQLYETMQALADQIASKKTITQELGLRMVGDATAIMAETYDKLGGLVAPDGRDTVSQMQMTDFIDPGVAEPLIAVQGQLQDFRFPRGRRGGRP